MKKILFPILLALVLFAGCKKSHDTFRFEGSVCGYMNCTLESASIAEQDFGYFISLSVPDSVGKDYYSDDQKLFPNTVLLYSTHTRLKDGEKVSGEMYLDEDYSKAYCTYHSRLDIPQGVCYRLD